MLHISFSVFSFHLRLLCFCCSLFSSFIQTPSERLRILYELINCPFPLYLSSVFHIYFAVLVSSASYWALSFGFLRATFLLDLSLWHDQCIKAGGLVSARCRMRSMRVKTSHLTVKLLSHSFPALILRFNRAAKQQETESYLCINKHWEGCFFLTVLFASLHPLLTLPPFTVYLQWGRCCSSGYEGEINFVIRSEIPCLYIILPPALLWGSAHEKWMSNQYLTKGHQSGPQPQRRGEKADSSSQKHYLLMRNF